MADFKKKLHDEIVALEYELRNELPKEILKARAHGDLSENAEYHAAKERQGFVNARLNQLKQRMAEMSMVDFSKIPHDRVGLGSRVVLSIVGALFDRMAPVLWVIAVLSNLTVIHRMIYTWQEAKQLEEAQLRAVPQAETAGSAKR
jgi:hypothetical protein